MNNSGAEPRFFRRSALGEPGNPLSRYASVAVCAGVLVLPAIGIGGRLVTIAAADLVLPVVVLYLIWFAFAGRPAWRDTPARLWTWAPFVAWFAWITMSAASGADFRLATIDPYVWKKLVGFGILAAYVVAGWFIARSLGYELIVRILLVVAAVSTIVGLLRLFLLPIDVHYASLPYGYRLLGMTHNPNLFGLQQAAVIVFALDWIRHVPHEDSWLRRPSWTEWLLATAMAGLWLSGSRTAIGAMGIVLVPLVVLGRLPFGLVLRSIVLSAVVALVGFGVFSGFRAWIEAGGALTQFFPSLQGPFEYSGILLAGEGQGVSHRAYIHDRAFTLFREHPWFGLGLGQFYLDFVASGDRRAGEIHNSYLWMLTELGALGALIALWCSIRAAVKAVKLFIAQDMLTPVCLLGFYGIAAFGADIAFQRPLYLMCGAMLAGGVGSIRRAS